MTRQTDQTRRLPDTACTQEMQQHAYTKIIIHDLTIDMLIGIYDSEKAAAQRVIINVDAFIDAQPRWEEDNIAHTVSYEDICNDIRDIAAKGHINLVETFAENIARQCFSYKTVQTVRIRVEKPDAIKDAFAVGVEIYRCRPD